MQHATANSEQRTANSEQRTYSEHQQAANSKQQAKQNATSTSNHGGRGITTIIILMHMNILPIPSYIAFEAALLPTPLTSPSLPSPRLRLREINVNGTAMGVGQGSSIEYQYQYPAILYSGCCTSTPTHTPPAVCNSVDVNRVRFNIQPAIPLLPFPWSR